MELGSVTLKRIGFFCFPIKHSTHTNPEHMAAVQLTREILQSDNEDWRSWALNFTTTQGDKPYSVADLMEKIVSQDKLRTAGGKPKKESALLAIKDGKARFKKKVTKPKICGNKACSKNSVP